MCTTIQAQHNPKLSNKTKNYGNLKLKLSALANSLQEQETFEVTSTLEMRESLLHKNRSIIDLSCVGSLINCLKS